MSNLKLPDGPKTHPWIQTYQWLKDPLGYMEECAKNYGDIFTFAPDAANKEFTGTLPANNQLEALENLTWALGLKYKISKEGQYHIYR